MYILHHMFSSISAHPPKEYHYPYPYIHYHSNNLTHLKLQILHQSNTNFSSAMNPASRYYFCPQVQTPCKDIALSHPPTYYTFIKNCTSLTKILFSFIYCYTPNTILQLLIHSCTNLTKALLKPKAAHPSLWQSTTDTAAQSHIWCHSQLYTQHPIIFTVLQLQTPSKVIHPYMAAHPLGRYNYHSWAATYPWTG